MKITRKWAMPDSNTFRIKPINKLIEKYHRKEQKWIDPFVRYNSFQCIGNDLNPEIKTDFNLESLEFLTLFDDCSIDGVFFDPPYSPRQIKECYSGIGLKVFQEDTQASFWSRRKDQIARILKVGGVCLSFGWSSNGIGINRGFEIIEILLVPHGGSKNDTICVVEKKIHHQLRLNFGGEE